MHLPEQLTINCVYVVYTDKDTYRVQVVRKVSQGENLLYSFNIIQHDDY